MLPPPLWTLGQRRPSEREIVTWRIYASSPVGTHSRIQRPNQSGSGGSRRRPCQEWLTGWAPPGGTSFISSKLSYFYPTTWGAEGQTAKGPVGGPSLRRGPRPFQSRFCSSGFVFLLSHSGVCSIMSVLSLPALFHVGVKRVLNPPQSAIQARDNDNQRCTVRLGWDFEMAALRCLLSSFWVRVSCVASAAVGPGVRSRAQRVTHVDGLLKGRASQWLQDCTPQHCH